MKNILLLLLVFTLSCTETEDPNEKWLESGSSYEEPSEESSTETSKESFNVGDIVYFKLDSTTCIVNSVRSSNYIDVYYKVEEEYIDFEYIPKSLFFKK